MPSYSKKIFYALLTLFASKAAAESDKDLLPEKKQQQTNFDDLNEESKPKFDASELQDSVLPHSTSTGSYIYPETTHEITTETASIAESAPAAPPASTKRLLRETIKENTSKKEYIIQASSRSTIKALAEIPPDVALKVGEQGLAAFSYIAPEHIECAVREVPHAQLRRNLAVTDSETAVFNIAGKDYTLKKLDESQEIDQINTIVDSNGAEVQIRTRLTVQSWTIGELGLGSPLHGTITTVYNKDAGETVINSDFREGDIFNNVKYIVSNDKTYEVAVKIDRTGLTEAAKQHPHPAPEARKKVEVEMQAEQQRLQRLKLQKQQHAQEKETAHEEEQQQGSHLRARLLALPQQNGKTVITVLFPFTTNAAREVGYSPDRPNDLSAVYAFAQDSLAFIKNALRSGGIDNVVFRAKVIVGQSSDELESYGPIRNVLSAKGWAERKIAEDPEAIFCGGIMSQSDNTWFPAGIASQGGCVPEYRGGLIYRDNCAFGSIVDKRTIAHEWAHSVGWIGAGHAEQQQREDLPSAENHNFAVKGLTIEAWDGWEDFWSQNIPGRGDVAHNNVGILDAGLEAIIESLQNYVAPPPTAPTIPTLAPTKKPTAPTPPPSSRPTPPTSPPYGDFYALIPDGQKSTLLTATAPTNGNTMPCSIKVGRYFKASFNMQNNSGFTGLQFFLDDMPATFGYQTNHGFPWETMDAPQQYFEIELTDDWVQFNFVPQVYSFTTRRYVQTGAPQWAFRILRERVGYGDLAVSTENVFAYNTAPTPKPTRAPTRTQIPPTVVPTTSTSRAPSRKPTETPSVLPTAASRAPSKKPTQTPSVPTSTTRAPSVPTRDPSRQPTRVPSKPPTAIATDEPTMFSTAPSKKPTRAPTEPPIAEGTEAPTLATKEPSSKPTRVPTARPTTEMPEPTSKAPTRKPVGTTKLPTSAPVSKPTQPNTRRPSKRPTTLEATIAPTSEDTNSNQQTTSSTEAIAAGISATAAIAILLAAAAYRKRRQRQGAYTGPTTLSRSQPQPTLARPNPGPRPAAPITTLRSMQSATQPPLAVPRAKPDQARSHAEQDLEKLTSAFLKLKTTREKVDFVFAMLEKVKSEPSKLMTLVISREFRELVNLDSDVKESVLDRITPENFPGLNIGVIKDRISKQINPPRGHHAR